ncbi:MAG: 2-phospho-L-lactate guanylyltransferase [Solirubrobacteraceae bacterium]
MRTAAILPVKRFARAKQRLGASVADPLRLELAEAMVTDVLLALEQTESIEQTILVTGESSIAATARERGTIVIEDGDEQGQPQAAMLGIRRALAEGIERVLCVPGDCPTLDPAELNALLQIDADADRDPLVVIVPDRHGAGTNGLLLSPPDAISPGFGPGSCERHRALAHAAGAACRVERVPSLLLDIDTGEDLDVLRARLAAHPARAIRTRAVLGQPERTNALPITTSV